MFWIVFLLWLFHWLTVCLFTSIVTCWLKLLEPSAYRLLPFICLPSIKFSVTTNSSKCVFNQSVASPQTNTKKNPHHSWLILYSIGHVLQFLVVYSCGFHFFVHWRIKVVNKIIKLIVQLIYQTKKVKHFLVPASQMWWCDDFLGLI